MKNFIYKDRTDRADSALETDIEGMFNNPGDDNTRT